MGAKTYLHFCELRAAVKKYGDREGLGTRQKNADGTFGEYKFISWNAVAARVKSFTAGLRALCEMSMVRSSKMMT
jgi:hypothetical protein